MGFYYLAIDFYIFVSEYSLFNMTDKKEQILIAALELFAEEGYNAISTSKIAKRAKVSEGLIFRHFDNKKGLLDALILEATEKANTLFAPILLQTNAKKVIQDTIALPFDIPRKEHPFWKLQFKLKWENDYSGADKMEPLLDKLTWAFKSLGFKEPRKEAEILNHIIESISIGILRDGTESQTNLKEFLTNKYLK